MESHKTCSKPPTSHDIPYMNLLQNISGMTPADIGQLAMTLGGVNFGHSCVFRDAVLLRRSSMSPVWGSIPCTELMLGSPSLHPSAQPARCHLSSEQTASGAHPPHRSSKCRCMTWYGWYGARDAGVKGSRPRPVHYVHSWFLGISTLRHDESHDHAERMLWTSSRAYLPFLTLYMLHHASSWSGPLWQWQQ